MTYLVRLACGHSGTSAYAPREGGWVSCWALVYPQEGCGTQRRIESVTPVVRRPRLLDLFCGAGGAGMGYHRAGFDVVGVDKAPMPRYPFEFHEADAIDVLDVLAHQRPLRGTRYQWLEGIDAVHGSPPCQDYSRALRHMAPGYPRLIEPVRKRLAAATPLWVIENVPGAPLPVQTDLFGAHGVELCGTMFGLPIWRHRLFESSVPLSAPRGCDHSVQPMNPHRAVRPGGRTAEDAWREAMGVGWMDRAEGREAVPPAYTEHIGRALLEHLGAVAA